MYNDRPDHKACYESYHFIIYEKGNYLCCYILYLLNMNLLRGLCASYSKAFPFKFWSMNLIIKYTLPYIRVCVGVLRYVTICSFPC